MRVRQSCLLLVLLLVPALAHADGHKADLGGGGSFGDGGSWLTGFTQSLAWTLKSPKARWLTIVLPEVSVRFGDDGIRDITQVSYAVGGRVYPRPGAEHKLFVQALVGAVYTNDGTAAAGNNKAAAFGVGYEKYFNQLTAAQRQAGVTDLGLGFRAQIDQVIRSDRDSFTRISVGVVYRFAKHPKAAGGPN